MSCEHDWRVNPNKVLTSNPPKQELRCATCGAISYRVVPGAEHIDLSNQDPKTWPKAEGDLK